MKQDSVTTRYADAGRALVGDDPDSARKQAGRRDEVTERIAQGSVVAALVGTGGTYEDYVYDTVPDELPGEQLQTMLRGGVAPAPVLPTALSPAQVFDRQEREERDRKLSDGLRDTMTKLAEIQQTKEASNGS